MAAGADNTNEERLRRALSEWRQGDFVLDVGFVYVGLPEDGEGSEFDAILDEGIVGLVVVSQTCDIVQLTPERQFVTLCPLVEIPQAALAQIASGRTPIYACLETPPKETVVADLSRMMTASKKLLASWPRRSGFDSDEGRLKFAAALERKHGRFAFPDAFSAAMSPFRNRVVGRHDRPESSVGEIYRSIREIRVRAAPHWNADNVEIAFIVILHDESNRETDLKTIGREIEKQVGGLNLPDGFSLSSPPYVLGTSDDLRASDLLDSQIIDFTMLSVSSKR